MKAKRNLGILMILLSLVLFSVSCAIRNQSQITKTSTVTSLINHATVSSIEIQNNSKEDRSYNIFWTDLKGMKVFRSAGPISLSGGEIKAGHKEVYNSKFNLGQCRIEWGPSRMWEKTESFKKNFIVNFGQRVIITSNPEDKPILMFMI